MSRHDPAVNSFYWAFQDAGVTEAEHTQSKFVTIALTSSVRFRKWLSVGARTGIDFSCTTSSFWFS